MWKILKVKTTNNDYSVLLFKVTILMCNNAGMDMDPNKDDAIVTIHGYPLHEHSIRRIMNIEVLSDEVKYGKVL